MKGRWNDLHNKEVINVTDGLRLGYVSDVELDLSTAKIVSLVIYGKPRFWGLFGKTDDIIIPWEAIETMGEDTVLARYRRPKEEDKKNCVTKEEKP